MSAIGPGDWVEFYRRTGNAINDKPFFVIGALYQVAEVGRFCVGRDGTVYPSLRVVGQPVRSVNGRQNSTPVECFRPVYRPRADLIETLLQPVDGVKPRVDA